MTTTRRILAVLAAAAILPFAAAQGAGTDQEGADAGKKSISALRKEVYEAEEAFYELYNELNDEDEYDVSCFYETATGTHVKNHVCRAAFISDSYARHASRNRNDMTRIAGQNSDPKLAEQTAAFEEKLATLVNSEPELLAAFQRYNDARVEFFAARDSR